MKKLLMALALLPLMSTAETETIRGITWSYSISDGKAVVEGADPRSGSIDTGLIGQTASGLPSGLKCDKTTGMITGAATKPGEYAVKFTKSGAETEEMTITVEARMGRREFRRVNLI